MIEIKTERIKMKHKRYYKVKKIKALDKDKLPQKYFNVLPHCYRIENPLISQQPALVIETTYKQHKHLIDMSYVTSFAIGRGMFCIQEEGIYPIKTFEALLRIITHCGKNLQEINKWYGNKTFKI
ncbi:MAG: hypothetical protein ACOC56_06420 [Atribacterota bacterium]